MNSGISLIIALAGAGGTYWALKQYTQTDVQTGQPQIIQASAPAPTRASGLDKLQAWLPVVSGLIDTFGNNNATSGAQSGAGRLSGVLGGLGIDLPDGLPNLAPTGGTTAGYSDVGPGGVDFAAKERQYGLPAGYLRTTAKIESSLNPNAQNPNSSAGGLFQFINATAAQYGLTNRFDPVAATDAAARLARDNKNRLKPVLGRNPTGGELYLAHQQGGGGASKLLRNRNARAVDVVGSAAVRLNGGSDSMTAGQFADLWINKYARFA